MKRKISVILLESILLVCIINFFNPVDVYAFSERNKKNEEIFISENTVEETINLYFRGRFEFQNNLSYNNMSLEFLDLSSSIFNNVKVKDELSRDLNKLSEDIVDDYTIDTEVVNLSRIKDIIEAKVKFRVDFKYKNSDVRSMIEEQHILYLKKNHNEKFIILADIFDEDEDLDTISNQYLSDMEKYDIFLYNETKNMEKNKESIIKEQNEIKEAYSPFVITRSRNTYNRTGAKNWALDNCHKIKWDFDADCTNFVSKAMKYGGHMKEDKVWYYHSNAWIRVIELRNWLINKGYAKEVRDYKSAMLGDIIQYKNSKGIWRHSVIVTSRTNKYPYVKVTAHSKNRRNVNVSGIYYPNGSFNDFRVLHITR